MHAGARKSRNSQSDPMAFRGVVKSSSQRSDASDAAKNKGVKSSVSSRSIERHHMGEYQQRVSDLLHMPFFDKLMGAVIMFNLFIIVVETDVTAERQDETEPDSPVWVQASSWFILILFIIELTLRIFAERSHFWLEGWNVFDFLVVGVDSTFSIIGLLFESLFPVSALRIIRLAKLARVSKVFRVFPELRLMLAGLLGSVRAIFWGTVLLVFCLLVWSIIAVQFIHPLNLKVIENGAHKDCERCLRSFESVSQSTLTLTQQIVAGDSWGLMTIPIIEAYPYAIVFFAGVLLTVGMAVLNLILGVVVNVAMQARDDMADDMAKENLVERMELQGNLHKICIEMDSDENGLLTKEELMTGWHDNEDFRNTLKGMDVQFEDLEILWTVLDTNKAGCVEYNTFISSCYTMKMSDSTFMLASIKYYVTIIKDRIVESMAIMTEKLNSHIDELAENEAAMVANMTQGPEKESGEIEKHLHEEDEHLSELDKKVDMIRSSLMATAAMATNGNIEGGAIPPPSLPLPTSPRPLQLAPADQQLLQDLAESSRRLREEMQANMDDIKKRLGGTIVDSASLAAQMNARQQTVPGRLWTLPACCKTDTTVLSSRPVQWSSTDDLVDPMAASQEVLQTKPRSLPVLKG